MFHPQLNLFEGLNGQGKTNLLEAIYFLSAFASFRNSRPEEMIRRESPYFLLEGNFRGGKVDHTIKTAYARDKKKLLKVDGNLKRHLSELIGMLNVVVFAPDDLLLMKGAPEVRRDFLDREIMQMATGSYGIFQRYRRSLRQRNNLLKNLRDGGGDRHVLAAYDRQLAENGARILAWRKEAIDRLLPLVRLTHRRLSGGKEELLIRYDSHFEEAFWKRADVTALEEALFAQLAERWREDIARGSTTLGPHRDDLLFFINGDDIRKYSSQGQQRTAVLAVKIGELELMKGQRGEYPLLLLDDVLSELDEERRQSLLGAVNGRIQTFITSTGYRESFVDDCCQWLVENGQLKPIFHGNK